MEGLITLQNDINTLKTKGTGATQIESELYNVLVQSGQEIIETLNKVIIFRQTMSFHKGLDALLNDVTEYIDEMHEIYKYVIEAPYKTIRLKRLFESLDEVMGGIDDFIESVNELFEGQGFNINYIENWDVGFFIENM